MEYEGSLIRQLLNETDIVHELEDEAEVIKDQADFAENLRLKETLEDERKKRQREKLPPGTEKAG